MFRLIVAAAILADRGSIRCWQRRDLGLGEGCCTHCPGDRERARCTLLCDRLRHGTCHREPAAYLPYESGRSSRCAVRLERATTAQAHDPSRRPDRRTEVRVGRVKYEDEFFTITSRVVASPGLSFASVRAISENRYRLRQRQHLGSSDRPAGRDQSGPFLVRKPFRHGLIRPSPALSKGILARHGQSERQLRDQILRRPLFVRPSVRRSALMVRIVSV